MKTNPCNFISVLICTHNRCESLKDTLNSLLKQNINESFNYEIIIVDNNSTDKTKELIKSYLPNFNSRLRYFFEPIQGKSYAMNKGIREANGTIIVFTDDDVIVDKHYLSNIVKCFREHKCDGIGGKIKPIWLKDKPSWLCKELYGKLAILDYGNNIFEAKSLKHQFYGANMAFKKELFLKYGLFKEELGRKGKKMLSGEDTDIFCRFLDYGVKLIYNPYAAVFHKIPANRIKKGYFIKWYFSKGQSNAYAITTTGRQFLGTPFWVWKIFFLFLFGKNQKRNFIYLLKIFYYFGFFYEKLKSKIKRCH